MLVYQLAPKNPHVVLPDPIIETDEDKASYPTLHHSPVASQHDATRNGALFGPPPTPHQHLNQRHLHREYLTWEAEHANADDPNAMSAIESMQSAVVEAQTVRDEKLAPYEVQIRDTAISKKIKPFKIRRARSRLGTIWNILRKSCRLEGAK